jgi:hypothetical protein
MGAAVVPVGNTTGTSKYSQTINQSQSKSKLRKNTLTDEVQVSVKQFMVLPAGIQLVICLQTSVLLL